MIKKWTELSPALQFIIKSVLIVGIWRLVYLFVLQPIRFPDKVLTRFIGEGTTVLINIFGSNTRPKVYCIDNSAFGEVVLIRGRHAILHIGDACNGLELMLIYAGVIALLPGNKKRKTSYIVVGLLLLLLANMLRCTGLEWVYEWYRPLFETTHHYIFTLVMYVFIFIGWTLYINKGKFNTIG